MSPGREEALSSRAVIGIGLLTLIPGQLGGSETYARELTRALARHGELDYLAFTPPLAPDAGDGLRSVVVHEYGEARTMRERALAMGRAGLRPRRLRRRIGPLRAAHFPLTVELPRSHVPTAVTVHDLQHLAYPELFSGAERLYRRVAYHGSAWRARLVIVPSGFVRDTVVERLGIPPQRVRVIHHGIDHELFAPNDDARESFLLYPARPWPHKNHTRLFEAFSLLRREHPDLELVLTGGGHDQEGLPDGVRVAGLVSAEALASLYRRAAALVFPSLYEGFGAPPLEAMACGCPVAVSRAAALPEVCGDAVEYFDPHSAEDIAMAVTRLLAAPQRLVAHAIAHARSFTWERSSRAHDAVYAELLAT
jgi:glycosyltransferase involved in cell wall biosynthesis